MKMFNMLAFAERFAAIAPEQYLKYIVILLNNL